MFSCSEYKQSADSKNQIFRALCYAGRTLSLETVFIPIAILKLPTKEEIGPNGLPSDHYSSDHLALETKFIMPQKNIKKGIVLKKKSGDKSKEEG